MKLRILLMLAMMMLSNDMLAAQEAQTSFWDSIWNAFSSTNFYKNISGYRPSLSTKLLTVTAACGTTYALWYSRQKSLFSTPIQNAKEALENSQISKWKSEEYPTAAYIVGYVPNNNTIERENLTLDLVDEFSNNFCQCTGIEPKECLRAMIDEEIKAMGDAKSALFKEGLTTVKYRLQTCLNRRQLKNLTQAQEREVDACMNSYIRSLGLPSSAYALDAPGKITTWLSNTLRDYFVFAPVGLMRSFTWPYEGEAAQLWWDLTKEEERLKAIRGLLVPVAHRLQARRGPLPTNMQPITKCGSKYCRHQNVQIAEPKK